MSKKRAEPDPVDPVVVDGVRYEAPFDAEVDGAPHWGGAVLAYDEGSGDLLWSQAIYELEDDPEMEDDKSDVYIDHLSVEAAGAVLRIGNEAGEVYLLDLETRAVVKAPEA